jgi:hypothetical protein
MLTLRQVTERMEESFSHFSIVEAKCARYEGQKSNEVLTVFITTF